MKLTPVGALNEHVSLNKRFECLPEPIPFCPCSHVERCCEYVFSWWELWRVKKLQESNHLNDPAWQRVFISYLLKRKAQLREAPSQPPGHKGACMVYEVIVAEPVQTQESDLSAVSSFANERG